MTREDFLNEQETTYADWFGKGDLKKTLLSEEKYKKEKAISVNRDGMMVLIEFSDCFVCCGYDGNEYEHSFEFKKGK